MASQGFLSSGRGELLYFLTPMIAEFKARNASIRMEAFVGNSRLNLA